VSRAGSARAAALRGAVVAVAVGAAVFTAPALVRPAHASDPGITCTAECAGGKCTGSKPSCVCSCHWLYQTPICNCKDPVRPSTPG
jgi:hypothetical protein